MGVSFMGIGTRENNKEKVISALAETFGKFSLNFSVNFEGERFFEEIINRKPDNETLDIFASAKGTLLTMSHVFFEEHLSKETLSEKFDFIYFDVSDTSNSYHFAIYGEGKAGPRMNVWDLGNNRKRIAGTNFLNISDEEDVFMNSFPRAVDEYLPATFHSIDLTTKIERYKLKHIETKMDDNSEKTNGRLNTEKKTFWQKLFR